VNNYPKDYPKAHMMRKADLSIRPPMYSPQCGPLNDTSPIVTAFDQLVVPTPGRSTTGCAVFDTRPHHLAEVFAVLFRLAFSEGDIVVNSGVYRYLPFSGPVPPFKAFYRLSEVNTGNALLMLMSPCLFPLEVGMAELGIVAGGLMAP
jgi:hypothetical protein